MDPFSDLRNHSRSGHQSKARLNVVLQAITQVIMERRVVLSTRSDSLPCPTEYFAAFMTALEGGDEGSIEDVCLTHASINVLAPYPDPSLTPSPVPILRVNESDIARF